MSPRIQSILFDIHYYTIEEAIRWLYIHDYKVHKVDFTNNFMRFRQFPTNKKYHYATKDIDDGIKFILAYS